jgi:hypothetical protein
MTGRDRTGRGGFFHGMTPEKPETQSIRLKKSSKDTKAERR